MIFPVHDLAPPHREPRSPCGPVAGLLLALLVATAAPGSAQQPCGETPGFDALDFWVGEWDVFVDEQQVGTNRISKILDGCAVTEEWRSVDGGEGRSLFYYLPWSGEWKQVWVTARATRMGGVKEKTLVDVLDEGALRFRGRLPDATGDLWYDRTTLTPLPDGRVRQVIEVSRDGESWDTTFNAVYVPRAR